MSERRYPAIERMTYNQMIEAMDRAARKIGSNEEMAAIWGEMRKLQRIDEKYGRGEGLTVREKERYFKS